MTTHQPSRYVLPARDLTVVATLLLAAGFCLWRGTVPSATLLPVAEVTPVSLTPQPDCEIRCQPIETIRVGQRMWVGENPSSERDHRFGDDVDPQNWRTLILRCPKRDGGVAHVEMLRPVWWLEQREVRPGGQVDIDVPECGIEGLADVLAVEPCPQVRSGAGKVVTATFHHQAAQTINVSIEGIDEPIGTTPNHPIWSATAGQFVRADELRPGGQVLTLNGLATVVSISPRGPPEPVYNLEVLGEHVFRVAGAGLLVHNGNSCAMPDPRGRPGYDPGAIHQDHPVAKALGGDPNVTRDFPAAANLRKGGFEGNLRKYQEFLVKNGMEPEDAVKVIQSEIDSLSRDVIAQPFTSVFPPGFRIEDLGL